MADGVAEGHVHILVILTSPIVLANGGYLGRPLPSYGNAGAAQGAGGSRRRRMKEKCIKISGKFTLGVHRHFSYFGQLVCCLGSYRHYRLPVSGLMTLKVSRAHSSGMPSVLPACQWSYGTENVKTLL